MRPYAERKQARIERLRSRSARLAGEAASAFKRADIIASVIPLGQPLLVGHHSERRHRRDIARIDNSMRRGVDASRESDELARRAEAAELNDAISSDDPEAVTKLRAKLEGLEAKRERYKEINVTIRTAQRHAKKSGEAWEPLAVKALGDMGIGVGEAKDYVTPDFAGRIGVAPYQLSNLGGNITTVKQRIAHLEARAARPEIEPETYGDIRVEESENRIRIHFHFPGKPSAEVRTELKQNGFRWSPTDGCWQAYTGQYALEKARAIAKKVSGT